MRSSLKTLSFLHRPSHDISHPNSMSKSGEGEDDLGANLSSRSSYRPAHGTARGTSHYPNPNGEGEGEAYERMVNVTRYKGRAVVGIKMDAAEVPTAPDPTVVQELQKEKDRPDATTTKLLACLQERPMWTRTAILNQLTPNEKRVVAK